MSTPFLLGFSTLLVRRLVADGLLEVAPDRQEHAVAQLAEHLAGARGASLLSAVAAGLLAAPDVIELYADEDDLKAAVASMSP